MAVAAIAVLALQIILDRDGDDSTVLAAPPAELVGTWVTDDPRYAGSALVIGHDHVELDPGAQGGTRSHPILSIRAVQGPDSWTYEIDYENSGREVTMGLDLHPDGVLRLRNPADMVWRRKPAS